jgi:hypothetical protein
MEEKSVRFVNIDHDTPMLLPPDLRDWVSSGHMVHFVMDALVALDLSRAHTNERGTGSAQYPPSMMLGLLIYCYATGTFSSLRAVAALARGCSAREALNKGRADGRPFFGEIFPINPCPASQSWHPNGVGIDRILSWAGV